MCLKPTREGDKRGTFRREERPAGDRAEWDQVTLGLAGT